jgi:AGCS family alanine or glycine:cation symporter
LFGEGKIKEYIYKGIFLIFIVVGAASSLGNVMDFSDLMILGMAFPNILGLVFLSGEVKQDMKDYLKRVKTGVIKKYK